MIGRPQQPPLQVSSAAAAGGGGVDPQSLTSSDLYRQTPSRQRSCHSEVDAGALTPGKQKYIADQSTSGSGGGGGAGNQAAHSSMVRYFNRGFLSMAWHCCCLFLLRLFYFFVFFTNYWFVNILQIREDGVCYVFCIVIVH